MSENLITQCIPFSYPGIDGDIQRLGILFKDAFLNAGMEFHDQISVLNLACGRADETGVLAAALVPSKISFYIGLDLRADAIAEARQRWELKEGEIEFREGNAAMLGKMKELPEFDVIFIRHQNYWHDPMVWEGILDEANAILKNHGYLICTSYFDLEHELFLASMRERGAKLMVNLRHSQSRELTDAEGKSVDRWIAIWQKNSEI